MPKRLANPMRRFLPRSFSADPHTITPSGVTQWLEAQPQDQPVLLIENLIQRVKSIRKQGDNPRSQLKQLEQLLGHADPVLRRIERSLDQCKLPLDANTKASALQCDRLLKNFTEAYIALARALADKWLRVMHRHAHTLAILRAAQLCYRRAMVAHRAHAAGSTRRWAQLHALLRIARQNGFADQRLDSSSHDTVANVYIHTALIALLDASSLGGTELGRARFYVERFGHHARIIDESPSPGERIEGLFILSDSSRGPRRLKADYTLQQGELILDCRPLIAKTAKHLAGLRKGMEPARLSLPMDARDPAYGYMLSRCMEQWSEPRSRKDARKKSAQIADLVTGFDSVRHILATAAFKRSRSESFDGIADGMPLASQWSVVDHSSSGFGLRFAGGHAAPISIGELIALRPAGTDTVFVCATRRVRHGSNGEVEIGLEVLSDQAAPASMARPMGKKTVSIPVLLMPKVARLDGSPGLIAPMNDVAPGMTLEVPHRGRPVQLEAREAVERLSSCELIPLLKKTLPEGEG
ncbi:MAG: hypothetical protein QM803_19580 [Rhodocyclaceae bacterium]